MPLPQEEEELEGYDNTAIVSICVVRIFIIYFFDYWLLIIQDLFGDDDMENDVSHEIREEIKREEEEEEEKDTASAREKRETM